MRLVSNKATIALVAAILATAGCRQSASESRPPRPAANSEAVARGARAYAAQCALCHGPAGAGGLGPDLRGVLDRRVAATSFGYTPALRKLGGHWDRARLDAFLAQPQRLAPGTSMAVAVADIATRADLVAFLASLPAAKASGAAPASAKAGRGGVFGGWRDDAPGRVYRISPSDLPAPAMETSADNPSQVVARPKDALPKVPPGFGVSLFAEGLAAPRMLRTAPNGDVFVAETDAGRIRVLRPTPDGGKARTNAVFAQGLGEPFGLAFYPQGPNPRWLYVAETNRIVRFAYTPGAQRALGPAEVVVARLSPTSGGHSNRDLAVSLDGRTMFVGIGSASNVADDMSRKPLAQAQANDRREGLGATWGEEAGRARVVAFAPEGGRVRTFATGLRNCSGIAVQPGSGAVWCSTNERDRLGDNLVPDYVTRVPEGAFFGWPWWYIGSHEDPRRAGERPDLRERVRLPDVLLQPHSASLGLSFAEGARLPPGWSGSALVAEHGSWNRAQRTGPKLIRIPVDAKGVPTGEYEDVMTGFVVDDARVWGRPVAVAVAGDGALLISDDAGGVIWRLDYTGDRDPRR